MSASLFDRVLSSAEMPDAFGAPKVVQPMLDFESALACAPQLAALRLQAEGLNSEPYPANPEEAKS